MNKLFLLPVVLSFALSAHAQSKASSDQFEQHKERMWSAVDINNDNKITRQEALAKASELFDKQDLNKDGVLTKDEVQNRATIKAQKHPKNSQK